jgi:single-strand selective monofunctional uracil DNA glycosylase
MRSNRRLIQAARRLSAAVNGLKFAAPVSYVYNPLHYAWDPHEAYLRKFGSGPKRVIFLGMNPGPFGMVQTGVPFGEIAAVRDWLRVKASVGRPEREHPRRAVTGFACARSEVSGQRLWGLFAERFGRPENFFTDHLVMNYCPLAFVEITGRNRTPDKLAPREKAALFAACDEHLRDVVTALQPEWLVGIGDFAFRRAEAVFQKARRSVGASERQSERKPKLGRILHPSPASPAANRNWAVAATKQMKEIGIWS